MKWNNLFAGMMAFWAIGAMGIEDGARRWNCRDAKNNELVEISFTEEGDLLNLKRPLVTKRGTVPEGVYEAETAKEPFARVERAWFVDVARFIPDYDEDYHKYRRATLAVFLEKEAGKDAYLFVAQSDKDVHFSDVTHLLVRLQCEKLE